MDYNKTSIGFIGAGRVGFSLGRYFKENGLSLSGYYSRSPESAKAAAQFTESMAFSSLQEVIKTSDVIFITVNDGAIKDVADEILALTDKYASDSNKLSIKKKIFCHCSGAMTSAVFANLKEAGAYGYSIHPMFAINDKQTSYKELSKAFFTIEGDKENIEDMAGLIKKLGNNHQIIDANNKSKYHSASVMASNLVIGLYAMAADTLEECGFEREDALKALMPLFINNALNVERTSPRDALTGPVDRADYVTVKKHMDDLEGDYKKVYSLLSKRLVDLAKDKHEADGSLNEEYISNYNKIADLLNN